MLVARVEIITIIVDDVVVILLNL